MSLPEPSSKQVLAWKIIYALSMAYVIFGVWAMAGNGWNFPFEPVKTFLGYNDSSPLIGGVGDVCPGIERSSSRTDESTECGPVEPLKPQFTFTYINWLNNKYDKDYLPLDMLVVGGLAVFGVYAIFENSNGRPALTRKSRRSK